MLLVLVLAAAAGRPFGCPEAVIAVPAAAVVVGIGAVSVADARSEVLDLAPVVGFLAAVLVLSQACAVEGLFLWCGAWIARAAGGGSTRLLLAVFAAASLVTVIFSLDATVVLLTPVVSATAAQLRVRARPHLYACAHLSNTASLLLPVSNLTNLLAFSASGLSFPRFTALMMLPWMAAIGVEYLIFRRFFADDLRAAAPQAPPTDESTPAPPKFAIITVVATLAGFLIASAADVNPAWAAAAGALILTLHAAASRKTNIAAVARSADVPFLIFVLALGVVVRAVIDNGLDHALRTRLPHPDGLLGLLAISVVAAVAANVVNNLPAVLMLVPLIAATGPAAVLAVLLGVNIGPNLTYTGSLATMLWRRVLRQHDHPTTVGEYTRLGLLTTPAAIVAAVVALWASLHLIGS